MREPRRRFLQTMAGAAVGSIVGEAERKAEPGIDLARARCRERWLHHPVLGDPSWDTFQREPGNPIHIGAAPYLWPVNGFLFLDPPSGRWYAFVSVYPRGYWGTPPANCLLLRERPEGGWEPIGPLFSSGPYAFANGAQAELLTDASVVYAAGRYHLICGWANGRNTRGGLAYAWAERPEGPYHVSPRPLHDDAAQSPLLGRYTRAYASTLLRRKKDWLILHMMSTPGNAGGTWALFAMTAQHPEGPYSAPVPLLLPQSDRFHPPLAEYFPAFAQGGHVYAPATSVALNRAFQSVWRAPLERAHEPESWELAQYGSVWHEDPGAWAAQGIWGQTFSGQVTPGGTLRVLFPSKSSEDIGAIHLARRPWKQPYQDGFALSAPRGPSLAILRQERKAFTLHARVRASGAWALCWGCRSPLGPDHPFADSSLHPLARARRIEWRRSVSGWTIAEIDAAGNAREIARGGLPLRPDREEKVSVTCGNGRLRLQADDQAVWEGALVVPAGRLELRAETGTLLSVAQFTLTGRGGAGWEDWLATEALAGSAAAKEDWQSAEGAEFRFGTGYVSRQPGARAKWNYSGRDFRLYAPRSPEFGRGRIVVDGQEAAIVDFHAMQPHVSAVVLAQALPSGRHAVVLEAISGVLPCDTLQILAGP